MHNDKTTDYFAFIIVKEKLGTDMKNEKKIFTENCLK